MTEDKDEFAARRLALLGQVDDEMRETASQTGREYLTGPVREAIARVPRHRFLSAERQADAYRNAALPIGQGQTISQPFIVGLMTDLLELEPGATVLEIGCGSGYQAAVLSELGARVVSVEVIPELAAAARARLADLGYAGVDVVGGDGFYGYPQRAPYDAIIVTAAAPEIPAPLLEQLVPGGRMVIPVGAERTTQNLQCVSKSEQGAISIRSVLPVVFVPFRHESSAG